MATIQRSGYSPELNQLSLIYKALGHPARLKILNHLLEETRVPCKKLTIDLPMAQATASGHIKILFETGILGYEKDQNVTYYIINPLMLELAQDSLKSMVVESSKSKHDFTDTFFKLPPELN